MQKKVNQYVDEIASLTLNSASSILKIGLIMYEAKESLPKDEYQEFLNIQKYNRNSSSIRKWDRIGKCYHKLITKVEFLPANWSTIYKLTTLTDAHFNQLFETNFIHPTVSVFQIENELFLKCKKSEKAKIELLFNVNASQCQIAEFYKLIQTQLTGFNCEVKASNYVKSIVIASEDEVNDDFIKVPNSNSSLNKNIIFQETALNI